MSKEVLRVLKEASPLCPMCQERMRKDLWFPDLEDNEEVCQYAYIWECTSCGAIFTESKKEGEEA